MPRFIFQSMFISCCLLGVYVVPPVRAVDVNLIEQRVLEVVEEKQEQEGSLLPLESATPAPSQPVTRQATYTSPKEKLTDKVFWQAWGGRIKLQRHQGQLYLSLWSSICYTTSD